MKRVWYHVEGLKPSKIIEIFYLILDFFSEIKFKTFIGTLLEASENDPDFTDVDIRDEVITMMFAVIIIVNK